MSNKYLEKAAALFPSTGYKKTLNKDERRDYKNEYTKADTASFKNIGKTTGAGIVANVGALGGLLAGVAATKKPAQFIARQVFKGNAVRGVVDHVASSRGTIAHGVTRVAGGIAGAAVGAIPGASMLDKIRHKHAKGVIENRRKKND